MAIIQDNPDKLVPHCHKSGFYWSKDDGGGSDNWNYKICKAPVKSSPPRKSVFYRPDALPVAQPTVL